MEIIEIKKILDNYGLHDKEARLYLALLTLGKGTVREIAKESRLKRTSIYAIADKLVEKGIIGEFKAKYGTHYVAASPRSLVSRLDKIREEINRAVPQLEALEKKAPSEPVVKFYRGRDGYISILNDSLAGYSHQVYAIGSAKDLNEVVSEKYVEKYIAERLKRRIQFKQIVFDDDFSKKLKGRDSKELRQTKFMPNDYKFEGNKLIYKNKVAFFSSKKEMVSLVIESKDIAEMEMNNFNLLWDKI